MNDIHEHLDNEWFVVRHSGEMPEIAYHSAVYYLTKAEDGPGLSLDDEDLQGLKEAASQRYKEIVLRDLEQANLNSSIYRGIKRSIVNYQRYQTFCKRQNLQGCCIAADIAGSLLLFLTTEMVEVAKGVRHSVINCSFPELNTFAIEVGLVNKGLPAHLAILCEETGLQG